MAKMIFVNLPVADVAKATAFYEAIGFVKDERFSNPQGASLKWSDTIMFGLLDKAFYATLNPKPIADTRATAGAMFALSLDSREEVDAIAAKAVAAGGREVHGAEDEGFMYSRAFEDLDGFAFGPLWMDPGAASA